MPRRSRDSLLYNSCFAHVISRSFDNRYIFESADDFIFFQSLLLQIKKHFGFKLHHYCLMNTHFHLAVSMPSLQNFQKAMQQIKWGYTQYFNTRNKRRGPIWRERFKSLLIEDESYLYACGLYIEYNPVKAGMVERPEDWAFSSARHYFSSEADLLIDLYETADLPEHIDLADDKIFSEGMAIGSELFKLQLSEESFAGA